MKTSSSLFVLCAFLFSITISKALTMQRESKKKKEKISLDFLDVQISLDFQNIEAAKK